MLCGFQCNSVVNLKGDSNPDLFCLLEPRPDDEVRALVR